MQTYAEIHNAHQGKSSDKWESYLRSYERLFDPYRQSKVGVLEVGVQNGGSLEVLAKYFESASQIIGCDKNPACGDLRYEDPRISVVVGDINSQEVLRRVANLARTIDIFIDDGSHVSRDIITTFVIYFPIVAPGGLYLIEDTHCLYWEGWGGGVLRSASALQLFKLLTDVLNWEHWQTEVPLHTFLSSFFAKDTIPVFLREGWIESIEFRNSMIAIRKAEHPKDSKLGARTVVGREFSVEKETEQFQRT